MNDKEIRELLRELSEKAGEPGQIKSKTISITLNDTPRKKKSRPKADSEEPEETKAARENPEIPGEVTKEDKPEEVGIPFKSILGKLRPKGRKLSGDDEEWQEEQDKLPEQDPASHNEDETEEKRTSIIRYEGAEPDFESDADDFRTLEEETPKGPGILSVLASRLAALRKRNAEDEEDIEETAPGTADDSEEDAPESLDERSESDFPVREKLRGGEDTGSEKNTGASDEPFGPDSEKEEEQQPEPEQKSGNESGGDQIAEGNESGTAETPEEIAPSSEDGEGAETDQQGGEIPVKKERKPLTLPFGMSSRMLLAILAALAVVAGAAALILNMAGNRRKTENVTADPGLTLTVESEPKKWSSSGKVTLGVRTPSPIQTITVNGENMAFSGKNRTKVSFETDSHLLDVMVVCEDSVLKGQALLQKIDGTAPELEISVSNGLVNMTASDDISGLEGIYVGTAQGLTTVPMYSAYTEPFKPEDGKMYYCTARDQAGNCSRPVVTDLTIAQSISLDTESMTMFPGETRQLQIIAEPAGAFLGGLRIVNSDSSVVSIDESGLVTALAEGNSLITISADNIDPVSCSVTVRTEASLTISFTGDCTLGDDVTFSTANSLGAFFDANGPEYFFKNVKDIFAEDDLTFVNLEGPFTDQGERAAKEYAFRGKPSYVEILTSGNVDAVTLANNHSEDYGEIGLTDTEKYLDEAGIDYCLERKYILKEINGVKVALLGIHALFDGMTCIDRVQETIDDARAQGAQLVIVAFHWGDELSTVPSEVQQQLGHTAIDLGADLVVGHHPHVLQGIEEYQGKYIVYSLANFCFGGNSNPRELDTMIFQMTFNLSQSGKLTDTSINIIPCSSSSAYSEGWNNYQPTPVTGDEAKRIIDKINERSEPFGFVYEQ